MSMARPIVCAAILALGVVFSASHAAPRKFIFVGWDTGDLAPYEIVANAARLEKTGCDGLGFFARVQKRQGKYKSVRAPTMSDEVVTEADLAWMIPDLKKMSATPWLKESMFRVGGAPARRYAWSDDARWVRYAANMKAIAATARKGGLCGLILDSEDYHNQRQYFLAPADGDFDKAAALARKRGAEVFGAVFKAFPEATVLTYQFFSIDRVYKASADPASEMRALGDLWPAYCNGILDVLPPGAKIVDGDESGYRYDAAKGDFWRNASHQLTGVLPLVAPENRAKYRAQVSVSFGQYPDSYAFFGPKSGWYFGPKDGSRLLRFEENLAQAVRASDEYLWFWGQYRTMINWENLDFKHWWQEWWPGAGSLDDALPGYSDMLRGIKDPVRYVKDRFAEGDLANLVTEKGFWSWQSADTNVVKGVFTQGPAAGHKDCRTMRGVGNGSCNFNVAVRAGEWYGVRVAVHGRIRGSVSWQKDGRWVHGVDAVQVAWDAPAADGWRVGWALARIPDGVNRIVVGLYVRQGAGESASLQEPFVAKLRDMPRGEDECTVLPVRIMEKDAVRFGFDPPARAK